VALRALVTSAYVDVERINVRLQRDGKEGVRLGGGGALFDDAVNREDYIAAIASEINTRMWFGGALLAGDSPVSRRRSVPTPLCALKSRMHWPFAVRGCGIST